MKKALKLFALLLITTMGFSACSSKNNENAKKNNARKAKKAQRQNKKKGRK